MKITVTNHGGTIHFHKAGCKDLTKPENKIYLLGADTFPDFDEALECYLGEDEDVGWHIDDMIFFPCTGEKHSVVSTMKDLAKNLS